MRRNMTNNTVLRNTIGFLLLVSLVALTYWFLDDKGRSWTFESPKNKCLIQPWTTIPSPMPQKKPYDEFFDHLDYKMPFWWKHQPVNMGTLTPDRYTFYWKNVVDGTSVWLTYYSLDTTIARYDLQTKEMIPYRILDGDKKNFYVTDLYLAKNGRLWITLSSANLKDSSALAYYDSQNDDFNIVIDQDGLFKLPRGIGFEPFVKHLGELSDGQLVVVLDKKIYLYNPLTNRAKLLLGDEKVNSIAIGNDADIWFMNTLEDYNLRAVNADTGNVTDYGVPPNLEKQLETQPELINASKAIAIDQKKRVWVSYFDRLEQNADGKYIWHSPDLPSAFVNMFDPYYAYRWANVFSTHVFSDGNVWFVSDVGIVKYDVKDNSWCLSAVVKTFTNYPITEDSEGNIWTVVDRQIYMMKP